MDVTFWGATVQPTNLVKGKILVTQVKMVRKTLFRNVIGVNYCCGGEGLVSTLKVTGTDGVL